MLIDMQNKPAIDSQRIDVIRARLDDNTYTVNSQQIADKIIDMEMALSGSR